MHSNRGKLGRRTTSVTSQQGRSRGRVNVACAWQPILKTVLCLLLLVVRPAFADDLMQEIKISAAQVCSCSKAHPCIISIRPKGDHYLVEVKKIVNVTEQGVVLFLPSLTRMTFDADGSLLDTVPTP